MSPPPAARPEPHRRRARIAHAHEPPPAPRYAADAWAALGAHRQLCGERIFTVDAAPLGPETLEPLLVLHGFPTSSYDYAAVLDRVAPTPPRPPPRHARLRPLGQARPPTTRWPSRPTSPPPSWPTLGVDRLALLTHDMGDTVGGELLARRAEGAWPVEITRRVVTNGSIYIEQAHLTDGQLMLLGLPDELLPEAFPITADGLAASLRATFSDATPPVPPPWSEDPVAPAAAQIVHDDGQRVLPRLIRYIEERRANERRFTGAIEADPSPLHVVWGLDDPIAVPSMVDTLVAARPSATRPSASPTSATTRWSRRRPASSPPSSPSSPNPRPAAAPLRPAPPAPPRSARSAPLALPAAPAPPPNSHRPTPAPATPQLPPPAARQLPPPPPVRRPLQIFPRTLPPSTTVPLRGKRRPPSEPSRTGGLRPSWPTEMPRLRR